MDAMLGWLVGWAWVGGVGGVGGGAVAGAGCGGWGWLCWGDVENRSKSCIFVVIFVCYLFVVLFVAAFYFCSFVGGQGHCLTRRFMKRCLAGAEDAWRISIVSSVVLCFVILFFI